jgi:hypothetical protein
VQQRGSLSLSSVEVSGAFSVSGGELSLSRMEVSAAQFAAISTASSVLRVFEVTVQDSGAEMEALTGLATWDADGVVVYDPPDSLLARLVRFSSS